MSDYSELYNAILTGNAKKAEEVTIVLIAEKRGNSLFVQGEEFTTHHESDSAE